MAGFGLPNFGQLTEAFKKAQQIQQNAQKLQEELEVMEIEGDYVEADFFVPAKVSQMEDIVSLWKRPSMDKDEQYTVHRNSILPIRPVFELNKFSTHRMVIYELVNADLVAKFV